MQYNFNSPISKLKRKLARVVPPGFMIYYLLTTAAVYILVNFMDFKEAVQYLMFNKPLILDGQLWRLFTFTLLPILRMSPLFVVLALIADYFIFKQLEIVWGTAEILLFLLSSVLAQIASGMLFGYADMSYTLFYTVIFIYSMYYSRQTFYFMVFPVSAKYFSYIISVMLAIQFFSSHRPVKMSILASLLVFFLYFRRTLIQNIKLLIRRLSNSNGR